MKLFKLYNEQTEAVVQRCSVKKAFPNMSQNPQEKHLARASLSTNPQA